MAKCKEYYERCYDNCGKIRELCNMCIKEQKAKQKKPVTTVTQWRLNNKGNVVKDSYTFNSTPDVDRVIRETIGIGALAIKIECPDNIPGIKLTDDIFHKVYIWKKGIGKIKGYGRENYPNVYVYWLNDDFITNADIESAIREYAKTPKQTEPVNTSDFVTMSDLQGFVARLELLEKEMYAHSPRKRKE